MLIQLKLQIKKLKKKKKTVQNNTIPPPVYFITSEIPLPLS